MKKVFRMLAAGLACTFVLGTASLAAAEDFEGYDENGNYVVGSVDENGNAVVGVADADGNVAIAVADGDGNYAAYGEDSDGNGYYEEN